MAWKSEGTADLELATEGKCNLVQVQRHLARGEVKCRIHGDTTSSKSEANGPTTGVRKCSAKAKRFGGT